jgi:hypothetical protein
MTTTANPQPANQPKRRSPRFNHVAMSVAPELLDGELKADLIRFYSDVFGWTHLDMMDTPRQRLVFQTYSLEQFVFLHDEPPMQCQRLDHYGFSVGTESELDEILARAIAFRDHDSRVDIIDKHRDDFGPIGITACYIGYVLPMMVEVQWWDKTWEREAAHRD